MWRRVLAVAVVTLMTSCMAQIDSVVTSVDPSGWYGGQPKSLAYANEDTTSLNTLNLIVRFDSRLTDSRLRMNVSVITPDSLTLTEQVTVAIPRRRGDVTRSTVAVEPFRAHAQLARRGTYRFEIEPLQPIFGVTGVGIKIENEEQD